MWVVPLLKLGVEANGRACSPCILRCCAPRYTVVIIIAMIEQRFRVTLAVSSSCCPNMQGVQQLAADVKYFVNIMGALHVMPPPAPLTYQLFAGMGSDGWGDAIRAAVAEGSTDAATARALAAATRVAHVHISYSSSVFVYGRSVYVLHQLVSMGREAAVRATNRVWRRACSRIASVHFGRVWTCSWGLPCLASILRAAQRIV